MFHRILNGTLPNNSLPLHQTLLTFPGIFGNIPWNFWRHSPDCLGIFPGMFGDISQNVWGHSLECLATFPGMFGDISRNIWRHSPEYNILPILRIPLPVPVLLVLYIAEARPNLCTLVFSTNMIEIVKSFRDAMLVVHRPKAVNSFWRR